jgi:hypothetical protein
MTNEEMIRELWSLANIIAGFSIAQSVGFAFALGKDFISLQSERLSVKLTLAAICVLFAALYSLGVYWCYASAMALAETHTSLWCQVTIGRIACIWIFCPTPIFALFAPNIFRTKARAV